jgi:hypothetical protein
MGNGNRWGETGKSPLYEMDTIFLSENKEKRDYKAFLYEIMLNVIAGATT